MSSRHALNSSGSRPQRRQWPSPRWIACLFLLSAGANAQSVEPTPPSSSSSVATEPSPRSSALRVFDLVEATAPMSASPPGAVGYAPLRPAGSTSSPQPTSDALDTAGAAAPDGEPATGAAPDATKNEDAANDNPASDTSAFSKIRVGIEVAALSSTLVPIPNGLEGKIGGFVETPIVDVDLASPFALFVRGRVVGSYAQAPQTFRPSWVPFSGKGGLAFVGERYQLGADISAGVRIGPVETMLDLGGRAGLAPGVARFVGPRAALQIRAQLIESVSIHTFVEAQHVLSLGDTALGWTASATGAGLGISYQF